VGRAGQYLDEVMETCGLGRDEVFISNAVKCRPPGNRTPTPTEIKACHDYLVKEIEAVNPDYIMVLGNPALAAVTKRRAGITKLMGTWLTSRPEFGSRRVFCCMHPSGVLRREFFKSKFQFAVQQFANIVKEQTSEVKTDYQLVTSGKLFVEAISDIKAAPVVAWDIENSGGFNPHDGGQILCIGFATRPGKVWVFPIRHHQMIVRGVDRILRVLKEILEAPLPKKVAQNGQYERKWMLRHGISPRMDFDTKIAAYLLDENGPTGLKPLARALCQAPVWDEGIDWNKGCYLGQELTARTKHRGLVRKRLLPVSIEGPLPGPGTPVMADGKEVGEMRSAADGLGLAMLHLEFLESADGSDRALTAGAARITPKKPRWAVF